MVGGRGGRAEDGGRRDGGRDQSADRVGYAVEGDDRLGAERPEKRGITWSVAARSTRAEVSRKRGARAGK